MGRGGAILDMRHGQERIIREPVMDEDGLVASEMAAVRPLWILVQETKDGHFMMWKEDSTKELKEAARKLYLQGELTTFMKITLQADGHMRCDEVQAHHIMDDHDRSHYGDSNDIQIYL